MAEKVKPLKLEDTTSGGELDMFPTEADPTEDYLAARGVAFKNQDTTLIDTDGSDNIQFTDPIVGTKSVDSVRSTARVSATDTTPNYLQSKIISGTGVTITPLNGGGNETLEIQSLFGTDFYEQEDDTESSTTSLTYIQKTRLTTPSIPSGTYFIFWFVSTKNPAGNSKEMQTRVQVDDTTTITEFSTRDTKDEWVPTSGFDIYTFTNAVHTIDIDFRQVTDTAFIRRARIAIWRID